MKDSTTKSATSQICKPLCLTLKDDSAKTNRRMKNKILKPTSNKKRYCVNSDTEIQIFETVKQLTIK